LIEARDDAVEDDGIVSASVRRDGQCTDHAQRGYLHFGSNAEEAWYVISTVFFLSSVAR
jgi:hypothetical protein